MSAVVAPASPEEILDAAHTLVYLHAEDAEGHRLAEQVLQLSLSIPALIEADLEYDAALVALKDLNRRIAEHGWMQVEHNALREAGMRLVAAESRRAEALARVRRAQ